MAELDLFVSYASAAFPLLLSPRWLGDECRAHLVVHDGRDRRGIGVHQQRRATERRYGADAWRAHPPLPHDA
jgi:hypothetical protein